MVSSRRFRKHNEQQEKRNQRLQSLRAKKAGEERERERETTHLDIHRPAESLWRRMNPILTSFLLCPLVLVISADSEGCDRPVLPDNVDTDGLQRYFNPGAELVLTCELGYTPIGGPRLIVCSQTGKWTRTRLQCIPKRCPHLGDLTNGDLHFDDTTYLSTINYTCHSGYIMHGSASAVCKEDGVWSSAAPECKPVSCGLPPIPFFGKITYERAVRGNTTFYGDSVTYDCRPPYVLFGSQRAVCTAEGIWTNTPECRVVTCPPPEDIDNGFMSQDNPTHLDFMDKVKYGCNGDYRLEGAFEIVCQQNGQWSEKPSCRGPCSVNIQRGRILYKEKKLWISELTPRQIFHREIISVYCLNAARNCGYAVQTQCNDGRLIIPECFKEPSAMNYKFHASSLPSEINMC